MSIPSTDGQRSPRVTACVATRGRGRAIEATLRSLANLDHDSFEVMVVDQSSDELSAITFAEIVGGDDRFTYLRSTTQGLSIARNIAIQRGSGMIYAFTDDDCVVPPDWLQLLEHAFKRDPDVGLVSGAVIAGEHDPHSGAIPTFTPARMRKITSPWVKYRTRGIGANFAARRDALALVGRFDEVLGAGAPLKSCEDGDMVYRFLRAGFSVLEVPTPAVTHYGFRDWNQLRPLSRDALMACGADCMKHLRMGDPAIVPTLLYLWLVRTIRWSNVLHLRRPVGALNFFEFLRGMVMSFAYNIDRTSRTYTTEKARRSSGDRRPTG